MKIKTTISEKRTRNREIRLQVRWEMISSCSYIYENAKDNTVHIHYSSSIFTYPEPSPPELH